MKSVDGLPPRRFGGIQAAVVATLLAASFACGAPPGDGSEPLEGPQLVSGSSLDRYGILVVPRAGGVAEFRSIEDPSTVRWTGRLELPATTAAYPLGRATVIRGAEGASLYVASPESLTPLPDVPPHARWIGASTGGAFAASGWALIVRLQGAREIRAEGEILWAAPAAGDRAVALVDGPTGLQLAVWEADGEAPVATRTVDTRGPLLLTGWGRVVVGSSDGGKEIVSWSLPDLEPTRELDADGPPAALAMSPSQHRVFLASSGRGRLAAVDRYGWRTVGTTKLDAPVVAIRASDTGDQLVAFDGAAVWSVRAGETEPSEIPGEWREDLPLPLPGGRILTVEGERLYLVDHSGSELDAVDGPVEAWWIPLRWGPRAPVTAVALLPEDTAEQLESPEGSDRSIGLMTMGTVSGRNVAAPGTSRPEDVFDLPESAGAGREAPAGPGVSPRVEAGFYAVANSSRRLASLRDLRRTLEAAGYPTHVLPRIDEANDTWYRLLVGPYASRPAAEAVSRELRRQRGIDAWIFEVTGDRR